MASSCVLVENSLVMEVEKVKVVAIVTADLIVDTYRLLDRFLSKLKLLVDENALGKEYLVYHVEWQDEESPSKVALVKIDIVLDSYDTFNSFLKEVTHLAKEISTESIINHLEYEEDDNSPVVWHGEFTGGRLEDEE